MITFRSPPADIDEVLRELPDSHTVAAQQGFRFVAGRNGMFVIAEQHDADDSVAEDLVDLAERTRTALAEHLPLVPFVHALVVSPVWSPVWAVPGAPTTTVPLDLLARILVEGPPVVHRATLEQLGRLVHEERLCDWRAATAPDAKMGGWPMEQVASEAC